ncbi:MAG: YqgE/AlgH family protein [Oligoflexales bacterium]
MFMSTLGECLLVAMPRLEDKNFHRAVVLLLEHGSHGAMGLTINHPGSMQLHEALGDSEIPKGIPTWKAGPVEEHRGFVLHNQSEKPFEYEIWPGVYLSSSQSAIGHMVEEESQSATKYPYRLLTGYAGWNPGQLDSEIEHGYWCSVPLDANLLFNTAAREIWSQCLLKAGISPEGYVN